MFSNGESAMRYFVEHIQQNAVYLLDEPENSLSIGLQKELSKYIADSARYYGCQFIITTHLPILLPLQDALIYDLDEVPICTKKWTELDNVKAYFTFLRNTETNLCNWKMLRRSMMELKHKNEEHHGICLPGELTEVPMTLQMLAEWNRSINIVSAYAREMPSNKLHKHLQIVLDMACNFLCNTCYDYRVDPFVLDYWDGESEDVIVTPFEPEIVE